MPPGLFIDLHARGAAPSSGLGSDADIYLQERVSLALTSVFLGEYSGVTNSDC
jgi:hypothetical protein